MKQVSLAVVALLSTVLCAHAAHPGKLVGALRWDAYYISGNHAERPFVQAALSNYQDRAPKCAEIVNRTLVNLDRCATQEAIDDEIVFAHNAGLDFWVFQWAGPNDVMMNAWKLYESSAKKASMRWALSIGYADFVNYSVHDLHYYIDLLRQSNYQTTEAGNPLIFLTNDTTSSSPTSMQALRSAITSFRAAALATKIPVPYVTLLTGYATPPGLLAATGADAVSFYAVAPQKGSYSDLTAYVQRRWDNEAATRQAVVPTAETGWNRRPIIEHPLPWEPWQKAMTGMDRYISSGTPVQIAAHVSAMLQFLGSHPRVCPQGIALIYSWNEHLEGGSTLNPTIFGNDAILRAVARAL